MSVSRLRDTERATRRLHESYACSSIVISSGSCCCCSGTSSDDDEDDPVESVPSTQARTHDAIRERARTIYLLLEHCQHQRTLLYVVSSSELGEPGLGCCRSLLGCYRSRFCVSYSIKPPACSATTC